MMSSVHSPLLISIPHCSTHIPPQIRQQMTFTDHHLKEETDLLTDQIFTLKNIPVLKASVSRYVVDLNRARESQGEKGVLVTTDFDNRPIYQSGFSISPQEKEHRLLQYWDPYHQDLTQQLRAPHISLFLDCHSMRPVGSRKAPDPGEERADIVLSNLGTSTGKTRPEIGYLSCQWEWLLKVAEILEVLWRPHPIDIAFNDPYYGGYITEHYSHPDWQGHKQGFQIEINRKLYLNWDTQESLPHKVLQLNQIFQEFLERVQRLLLKPSL